MYSNLVRHQYWDRFKIHTYPWDAGTDDGQSYRDLDRDTDPPENVYRFTAQNAPNGLFVNQEGNDVPPVAEWECILHVCPREEPDCQKEDWPPKNGCDVLKYPGCADECNPAEDEPCQECQPKKGLDADDVRVYYPDCCMAGRDPINGSCNGSGAKELVVGRIALALVLSAMAAVLV